ncbi:YbhB/YbcL family Raf kinase inhibitor-like protein [Fluoribacter dumoffii]|uniref:Putative kinase inhibitor n=1 Tax=Fluoribacter dumoffii TaxID=463 RepID=A0A377GD98_9GAMM|nr:YbhB/YbcL family Raf kinase inhibitor-like protein [Fluoribacter dumoffii]KTC91086.1 phosphatidylethanolamine-binding protein [Fluoribacter dumoffii NY 23]MCW8416696.1 YbhB/YbcL family Raf kinase inhibitor-like protein [Fluoribacter dumoffii]MCW8455464.1 YbhB/YbcL family Raf kinase inhibitor-like protein [Fluoribacter dumoffii]MCW8460458.1 YbhB/YbcL family Raf kinase inhibitor-like protein [Fluoribacter dumoffii]MCW8483938.1 YbhB/YbcL family Raf kinase inhibitor-like protein [Fluoribacter d
MKKYTLLLFLVLSLFHYNSFANTFTIKSSAFKMNSMIPDQYTCNGVDQSPPLTWSNIPPNTQSLALVVDDPDAPDGTWTHWIVFNIPPTVKELGAGAPVPPGASNAKNSWGGLGYRGPCPSLGAHSYHFKLYALDTILDLGDGTTRDIVLNAITGHVIGSAELVGLYQTFKKPAAAPNNTPAQ